MEASQGTAFGRTSLIRSQSVPRPGRVLPLSRMERFSPAAVAVDKLQRRGRGGKVAARADQPLGPFDYDGLTAELDRMGVDYRAPEAVGGVRRNPQKFASHIQAQGGDLAGTSDNVGLGKARVATTVSGFQTGHQSRVPAALIHGQSGLADTRREEADMARLLRFRRQRRRSTAGRISPSGELIPAGLASPLLTGTARTRGRRNSTGAGRSGGSWGNSESRGGAGSRPPSPMIPSSAKDDADGRQFTEDCVPLKGASSCGPPAAGDAAFAAASVVAPPQPDASAKLQEGLGLRQRNLREAWLRLPREPGGRVTLASLQRGLKQQGVDVPPAELKSLLEASAAAQAALGRPTGSELKPDSAVAYGEFARAVQWITTIPAAAAAANVDARAATLRSAAEGGHVSFSEGSRPADRGSDRATAGPSPRGTAGPAEDLFGGWAAESKDDDRRAEAGREEAVHAWDDDASADPAPGRMAASDLLGGADAARAAGTGPVAARGGGGGGGGDDDDESSLPPRRISPEEQLHEEYQARERRLTTTLGLGVTPDELPAAGARAPARVWGEPLTGAVPSTLPSRGELRLAENIRQSQSGLTLASSNATPAEVAAFARSMASLDLSASGAPRPPTHHRTTAREARIAGLRASVRERLTQVFGSGASAHRKAFLRFARTSDGSTDIRSAAEGLRGLGIKLTTDDVAGLVAAADPSYRDPAAADGTGGPGRRLQPSTRVDFATFVKAVEAGAASQSSIPQPYADESDAAAAATSGGAGAHGHGSHRDDGSSAAGRSGGAGGSVRTGLTQATSAAMLAHAQSGLGHHDRIVRDVCSKIKWRIDELGLTPSQTFLKIDAQRDGLLTHQEVREGMGRLGVVLSDNEMAAVVKAVDRHGTGIVDRSGLVTALFPPDADVMEATAGLDRTAADAESGGLAPRDSQQHRPARRMAPTALRQTLSSPQVLAAKLAQGAGTLESTAAGIGRSKLDEDFIDAEDLTATGACDIPDEWVRSDVVDPSGMYTTERDADLRDMNPREFRRREFHKPPPHYRSLVPRDAHGTTAPFLARKGQMGEDGVFLGDEEDRSVGFAELAAQHGPLPTRRLAARKKQNALLRRVFAGLEAKGGHDAARRLFMKVNVNHDAKVDYKELREGFARSGINITDGEFRMLMNRLDSDGNGSINYAELARAMKQDDPLPDETEEHLVGTAVSYRSNRYHPPPGASLTPGQGAPRVSHDSRGAQAAVDGLEAPAVAAASLEEARMSQEVVERVARKRGSLRDAWMRVKDLSSSSVPASELRSRLVAAGVTVSERQVAAFLTGGGARPMPESVTFSDFCELSRPRAFVEDARRLGAVSALQPRTVPGADGAPIEREGIGRYGVSPMPPAADEVPSYLAQFAFKTNTDPAGIMLPDGTMDKDERRAADVEAAIEARTAAEAAKREADLRGSAHATPASSPGAHFARAAGIAASSAKRRSGVYRAAQQEHAGLPTAGLIPARGEGRGGVAGGPAHAYRLWAGDRVRGLVGGTAPVSAAARAVAKDDFDIGRVCHTLTKAEQRRRRRRHSTDASTAARDAAAAASAAWGADGAGPTARGHPELLPPAGCSSGVYEDLTRAREEMRRSGAAEFGSGSPRRAPAQRVERRIRFGGGGDSAAQSGSSTPRSAAVQAVFSASGPAAAASSPRRRDLQPGGSLPLRSPRANQGTWAGPAMPDFGRDRSGSERPSGAVPAMPPAGLHSAAASPLAKSGVGRKHFVAGSGGVRDQHHSVSGIFDAPAYGAVLEKPTRFGSRHAIRPMGQF
ncbi:hypothetical protein FNF29_00273 [Cafeteria roenbergensis]|uniref:EF-hand domain-containing protein n=2 Tax=Cafeteria roenbergensis TaxID=33653 RepID=A0A5A8CYD9_CAFRO|nr:hypothetical protein FNF29_00273 [Cafeteria roenbergensis]|eukprot:KAA0157699.1 hypothetical protein FNF29_00273 [Cafeteria roenbergensis]